MKIPYGESDFRKIRTGKYLYIDKTAYIRQLEEQGSFNILRRPRRFGKSLFLFNLSEHWPGQTPQQSRPLSHPTESKSYLWQNIKERPFIGTFI